MATKSMRFIAAVVLISGLAFALPDLLRAHKSVGEMDPISESVSWTTYPSR